MVSPSPPLAWGSRPPAPALQGLIVTDIAVNFRVARFKDGELVTDKRRLALDYLRSYFLVDLLSGVCVDVCWGSAGGVGGVGVGRHAGADLDGGAA
jgi:hypothetical protein